MIDIPLALRLPPQGQRNTVSDCGTTLYSSVAAILIPEKKMNN